jgi:hypothetical protein
MRLAIHRSVISEYRTVPQDLTTKIYRPLFDLLFQVIDADQFCLPIFTTNYDPAIEQFVMANQDAYELIDGLEYVQKARRALWCSEQFDRFSLAAKKRNLVLFKLHGSADWVNSGDTIWKSDAIYLQPGTEEIENCLIYPATRKIATKDPYFTAYDYFRRCCDHARLCLSIGYSFRDYDALNQLQSAVHATESLTLALLSPNCLEVLKALPIPANRMGGLPFRFGDGEKESDYLAEIADLAKSTLAKRSSNDFA